MKKAVYQNPVSRWGGFASGLGVAVVIALAVGRAPWDWAMSSFLCAVALAVLNHSIEECLLRGTREGPPGVWSMWKWTVVVVAIALFSLVLA